MLSTRSKSGARVCYHVTFLSHHSFILQPQVILNLSPVILPCTHTHSLLRWSYGRTPLRTSDPAAVRKVPNTEQERLIGEDYYYYYGREGVYYLVSQERTRIVLGVKAKHQNHMIFHSDSTLYPSGRSYTLSFRAGDGMWP